MQTITSVKDPMVETARLLSTPASRARLGKLVLYGEESIRWALNYGYDINYILCCQEPKGDFFEGSASEGVFKISPGIAKKISDTSHAIPCIGVADMKNRRVDFTKPLVILDDIRDHGNIGTIIRTAAAFGFEDIVLTNTIYDVYYKNMINASRGLALKARSCNLPAETLLDKLQAHDYLLCATSSYGSFDVEDLCHNLAAGIKPAIIFGNETDGVSDALLKASDLCIKIGLLNGVESLNVGVAAGIILHRWARLFSRSYQSCGV
jgi:TrmH family RNA methyltransferase